MGVKKTIIMGAAGRDFHNFNVYFRDNADYEVVAFTATQIPDIEDRKYPAQLAGERYPDGIPIHAEEELSRLIEVHNVDEVFFSYSDVSYQYVMSKSALVNAAGATFSLLGARQTTLTSTKPVVAICAVRTGCGKSQTTRRVAEILKTMGKKVVAVRHPMPYGDLTKQRVQRFASYEDLHHHDCTIEEREEYEPHIRRGNTVIAGVDYEAILREAEKEADIILWDGGNNDVPFFKPEILITVVDPLRPGHEMNFYPGEINLRMADVVVINKQITAKVEDIELVRANVRELNPNAVMVDAASPIYVEDAEVIRGKRVLVVEDGPTVTHGGMSFGAGVVAAEKFGATQIVDPRPHAVGTIKGTFQKYSHLDNVLPAMGYGDAQMKELEATIAAVPCDSVIIGTPIDLRRLIKIDRPSVRVTYELSEVGTPTLEDVLEKLA